MLRYRLLSGVLIIASLLAAMRFLPLAWVLPVLLVIGFLALHEF